MKEKEVILHTGGNLGDRAWNLSVARRLVSQRVGPIIRASSIYQTQAWGITDQPDFLNQALIVRTRLPARETLREILDIEKEMGRKRTDKWTARLIDIDLLFYEDLIINTPELIVPHPYLHLRNFVLAPLMEIAPQKYHPALHCTVETLYAQSPDTLGVAPLKAPAANHV